MRILESSEDYLEAMLMMKEKHGYIRSIDIAMELGNSRAANMVMLGAYIEAMGNLGTETIKEMLVHMFTGPKAKLVDLNIEALRRGAACVR